MVAIVSNAVVRDTSQSVRSRGVQDAQRRIGCLQKVANLLCA